MLTASVVLYLAVTIGMGLVAGRRIHATGDFLNTGRNLHPALNTAAFFALWFGSKTMFGASARFAEHGVQGIIEDPFGGALCLLLVGVFYAPRMYRLNVLTIGDVSRKAFGVRAEWISACS
jgi:Na+/proline symporter